MCANASAASWRRWSRVKPPGRAASTSAYRDGSATTATEPWFLAAARTIDGPPMSICSTHSLRRGAGGDRGLERVQVRHQQLERLDAELGQLSLVGGVGGVGQQARVHPRVQRLDPSVQALGEPGQLLHLGDRYPRGRDPGGGAAGGDDLDAGRVQPGGEVLEPGLVVDADERPPDRDLSQLPILTFLPRTDQPSRTILPTVPTSRARSATLIRSCSAASSSLSSTGTLAWATIGPCRRRRRR